MLGFKFLLGSSKASQVRFMVDGERIAPDDTAEKLGLEDEDLIDVAMEQTGGVIEPSLAVLARNRLLPKPGCWEIGFRQISSNIYILHHK